MNALGFLNVKLSSEAKGGPSFPLPLHEERSVWGGGVFCCLQTTLSIFPVPFVIISVRCTRATVEKIMGTLDQGCPNYGTHNFGEGVLHKTSRGRGGEIV